MLEETPRWPSGWGHHGGACTERRQTAVLVPEIARIKMLMEMVPACDVVGYRDELKRRRHESLQIVGQWLTRVVTEYFNYHAVPGNLLRFDGFRVAVCRLWRQARQTT